MTLSKRYDAVMEKIEVTDEMRRRILAHIDGMDLEAAPRSNVSRLPAVRRLAALSACLLLLVAGGLSLRYLLPGETVDPIPTEGVVLGGSGIEEASDTAALGELVGFEVKELTDLPFRADEVTYAAYWKELAETTYTGEGYTLTLRQSAGEGDNSGDYNVYAATEVREMGDWSVTLKGDGENWTLAIWSDGTCAYSAHAEPGFTLSEWERVIAGL